MPAVHSRRVHFVRVSGKKSCLRRDWASATLYTSCQELSILACDTRRQPDKIRDPSTRAHGPLKKWDLNEARHEHRGYMRRMFLFTLLLSPRLGFPRREYTAGIRWPLKQRMHLRISCLRACSENLFFHELPVNQGKMTNQLRRQFCENCWRNRKIFSQTWKRTKIQTNTVPIEPPTSFVFVEKTDWRWFGNELFANPVLITRISYSRTGLRTNSQAYNVALQVAQGPSVASLCVLKQFSSDALPAPEIFYLH